MTILATLRKMEATMMGGSYSCPIEEMVCSKVGL